MSVSILLITHNDIGNALVHTATRVLGTLPLSTNAISVKTDQDPEIMIAKVDELIKDIGTPAGVLILTDLFGSTPSNIAKALKDKVNARVISGVNLPMILRIMNYPDLTLDELAEKALNAGKEGVIEDN